MAGNNCKELHKYAPTPSELKLIETLCNPRYAKKNISEICKISGISSRTYYYAMDKAGFRQLIKKTSLELVTGKLSHIINATIKFATTMPQCSADRKVLLQMADMIVEKSESSVEIKMPDIVIGK